MTLYSYPELREALDKASIVCKSISINGNNNVHWYYNELDDLQAIINALPEKIDFVQVANKDRADAWDEVIEHPFFEKELWGDKPILEAVLEKLNELHRGQLPTEYGSTIKNVKVKQPYTNMWEYDYMQLTNIGWIGVDKDNGVLQEAQPEHITSWEPCSE